MFGLHQKGVFGEMRSKDNARFVEIRDLTHGHHGEKRLGEIRKIAHVKPSI